MTRINPRAQRFPANSPILQSLKVSYRLADAWHLVCIGSGVLQPKSQKRRKDMKVKSNLKAGQSSAAVLD
jgi:hypothetical protein